MRFTMQYEILWADHQSLCESPQHRSYIHKAYCEFRRNHIAWGGPWDLAMHLSSHGSSGIRSALKKSYRLSICMSGHIIVFDHLVQVLLWKTMVIQESSFLFLLSALVVGPIQGSRQRCHLQSLLFLLHYPKSLSCAQQRAFHVRSKEHLTNQGQAISLPLHTTELPV